MAKTSDDRRLELLQGTLDMLILRTLQWGPQHGHGIGQAIRTQSDDLLKVETGSLYPALHRLEKRGWLKSEWGVSEANQRAKYYRLTATGKAQLLREQDRWSQLVHAIGRIMNQLSDLGVKIITERQAHVHVSGHPGRPELKQMYDWVRPQIIVPVHGEARHLAEHARLGLAHGVPTAIVQKNGDVIRLAPGEPEKIEEVRVGQLVLDGDVILPADGATITERVALLARVHEPAEADLQEVSHGVRPRWVAGAAEGRERGKGSAWREDSAVARPLQSCPGRGGKPERTSSTARRMRPIRSSGSS